MIGVIWLHCGNYATPLGQGLLTKKSRRSCSNKTVVSGPGSLQGEGSIRDRWQVVCTDTFICWDQIVINYLMPQVRLAFMDGLLESVLLLGNIIYLF